MNWNERAEKEIAFLQRALEQAVGAANLRLAFVDAGFSGDYWERHRGKLVIMFGEDDVLGLASHYSELALWLEGQQEAQS